MPESALMILHGFRAHSPVVTDTGCCPSAARRRRPLTFGTTIRSACPRCAGMDLLELLGPDLVGHRPPPLGPGEPPLRTSAGPPRLTSRRGRREQHLDPAANASGRGPGVD